MSNIAGYIKVQKDLKKMIIKGIYNQGDILPSENKLSVQYSLSRMTIRNALKNLENEGLIYRKKGKGSFVGSTGKSFKLLSRRGFTEIMKGKEIEIDTIFVRKPKTGKWKKNFYWELSDSELSAGCISFSRIRKIEDKPVMVEDACVSNIDLPNFCTTPFINNSLFDTLLINYDIEITGINQKFRAISASKELAKRLDLKKGDPVLEIVRKLSTSRPELYIYSFAYCNTDDFTIET